MSVRLAATEYGDGPPVAILHGLFGSGRNWGSIARHLAARHRVFAFDLRNHGASPWADTMSYREMAADVCETLAERGIERAALIGHSMGGKAAMVTALSAGERVERLVVVDIAPVAYAPHHLDLVQAMRRLDLAAITRRGDADAALAAAVPDAAERGFLLQNLLFDGGQAEWRLNLAAIEREMPELIGWPALPSGAVYRGPTLFVAGAESDYLLPDYEPEIRRRFPAAEVTRIAGAGHWLHAEQPAAFLATVEPFLEAS